MGKEAQVDHGSGPMVRDAQNGKYRRTLSQSDLQFIRLRKSLQLGVKGKTPGFRRRIGLRESVYM